MVQSPGIVTQVRGTTSDLSSKSADRWMSPGCSSRSTTGLVLPRTLYNFPTIGGGRNSPLFSQDTPVETKGTGGSFCSSPNELRFTRGMFRMQSETEQTGRTRRSTYLFPLLQVKPRGPIRPDNTIGFVEAVPETPRAHPAGVVELVRYPDAMWRCFADS